MTNDSVLWFMKHNLCSCKMSIVRRELLEECLVNIISELQMTFAPGETEARLIKTFVEKRQLNQC